MATFYDLRTILNDADSIAALRRYYERGWDRILAALALGIARPGSARSRALLQQLRTILATLDPRRSAFVSHWIRDWVRASFLHGQAAATKEIDGTPSKVDSQDMKDTIANVAGALESKLSGLAYQMETGLSSTMRLTQAAILQDVLLRDGISNGILRGPVGGAVAQDLQSIILNGPTLPAILGLKKNGIARNVADALGKLSKGIVTVGKASVPIGPYVETVANDALATANNAAARLVAQGNKIDHVFLDREWVTTVCPYCAGVEYNVFYDGPLSQDPAGFPRLKDLPNGGPKWHPNCAHVIYPWPISQKTPSEIASALASSKAIPADYFGEGAVQRVNDTPIPKQFRKNA
jgi:hypothetical protein